MTDPLSNSAHSPDLAGPYPTHANYLQIQTRVHHLIHRYLSFEHLRDRLNELPHQFAQPQPRPWKTIYWQDITPHQIIGMSPTVFLSILKGSIDTESPIRGYTQTSRRYLENLHPQLARFVGGTVDETGQLTELGLWEKEERQHTPALMNLYRQLSGEKVVANPHAVRQYQPSADPSADLYRHGLHRVLTEYGATCLYLWLMAHSTGALQAVLEELTLDEINHMTKFWGFGVWAYPDTSLVQVSRTLLKTTRGRVTYRRDRSSLIGTLHRMTHVLNWPAWSWTNRATFAFTCTRAMQQLYRWHNTLTQDHLQQLFSSHDC